MKRIPFRNKKVIVFDLDGTIVKLDADWENLKNKLVEQYKKIYKEECDVKRVSHCLSKVVEKEDEHVLESFFQTIRNYEGEIIKNIDLIEETIYFINNKDLFGIREQAVFAILSLNTRNTIIQALKIAGIYDKIDFIIGREDVRRWKPAPDGLLKIQDHYMVDENNMIFFGDLENDLLTGQNAGIRTYLIDDLIEYVNILKKKIKEKES